MSRKERVRLTVMKQIKQGQMKLIQGADVLGLSYRQTKRVWRRFCLQGDKGLVHMLRGRPGVRAKPAELKAGILRRYGECYADFGPTLAAEYLAEEGLHVDHETLRRWLLAAGWPRMRRRRQQHRQWRERKPCLGAMVQLDGSHHDWFEGRGERCVLMVMVDDACSEMQAQFFEAETTHASYDIFEVWTQKHGLPQSLYVDKDSIYRTEGVGSIAQQLAGEEPQTQFGRAMKQLGVELKLAHSPQAKGRVERTNGVLQDRLVKALRLEGISDTKSANEFLSNKYLPRFNRKFRVQPASEADVHRPVPRNLNEILSWEEERTVQRDWTVAHERHWYQLDGEHERLSLVGKKIIVRKLRNGMVQMEWRGQKLKWRELPGRPQRAGVGKSTVTPKPRKPWKPAANHPWKGGQVGQIQHAEQAEQTVALGDSVRPPLRSGLTPSPKAKGREPKGDIIS